MGKFDGGVATPPELLHPDYPSAAQFDLRLENDTLPGLGAAGDFIRCVDIELAGIELADGDLVVVEIAHRPSHREKRIMRIEGAGATRRLLSIGQKMGEANAPVDDPDIRIVAKILYRYRKV